MEGVTDILQLEIHLSIKLLHRIHHCHSHWPVYRPLNMQNPQLDREKHESQHYQMDCESHRRVDLDNSARLVVSRLPILPNFIFVESYERLKCFILFYLFGFSCNWFWTKIWGSLSKWSITFSREISISRKFITNEKYAFSAMLMQWSIF